MVLVLSLHLIFVQNPHSLACMQKKFHRIQESSERTVVGSPQRTEHSDHCNSTDSLEKIHTEQENMDEMKLFLKIQFLSFARYMGFCKASVQVLHECSAS